MNPIAYFKLQAKNLFRDYKTKKPVFDKAINDYLYEYSSKYFDVERWSYFVGQVGGVFKVESRFNNYAAIA